MSICPCIPETSMILKDSYGEARRYTVKITNLTQTMSVHFNERVLET